MRTRVEHGVGPPDLTLLDALPHMAWVARADGEVWYLNGRGLAYLGDDLARLQEHGWTRYVHPDDLAAAEASWSRAVATDEIFEAEYRIRRHDGRYRWHLDRGAAMRDADGTVTGWLGTCTDVHERRVADDALGRARRQVDEQLALLDALHDNAPIGLGFLDRDLRLVRANRSLVESGGTPVEEVLGAHVQELVPDAWDQLAPILDRVVTRRETVTDIPVTAPDPHDPTRVRHWSVSYYPVALGGEEIIGIGTLSYEETERLERIRQLQASEELRALAERAGSLGSWDYDLVAGTSRWSPGLRELLGLDADEDTSWRSFSARLVPEDRQRYVDDLRTLVETGRPATLRYRMEHPDGRRRVIEGRAACDVEDGEVVRIFGTTQDVTERVQQSERVEQIERLLTEAETMARMGSFETQLPSGDTLFSPGLRRLLGYGSDAPISAEVWRTYVHPADRDFQEQQFVRLLATGEMDPFQLRLVLDDDRELLVEIRGSCYPDADGTPRRLIGTALDVTERERLRGERLALLERSLTAADHERRRIAEHLHDDAVQALTATLLRVDHALTTGSTEPLVRARSTLEAAVRTLRLNIMELSPVDLVADGVEAAVSAYAEQLLELDGIQVHLQVALEDESAVPAQLLLTSYQIIREALANVRRHAQASTVVVAIAREDDHLVGEVTDDGVGIDLEVANRAGHLGLELMRQRTELAGGAVRIAPRDGPGSGTAVRWWLPC